MTIDRIGPGPINTRVVVHNNVAYLSGLVADDKSAGMADQTKQILAKIDKHLADAGTNKSRLLSATVYLSDMSRKSEMNEVWSAWIDPANPPARTTVGVELSSPETLIEITVTAAIV